MTFAQIIKEEVVSKEMTILQLNSLINGFIISSGQQDENFISIKFNNKKIMDRIVLFLKELNIDFGVIKNHKQLVILNQDYDFRINYADNTYFFAGVFLGSGSINRINSTSYHLQLSTFFNEFSVKLLEKLNTYENFNFKLIKQKNKFVIYIKKIDSICDFLRAIEAKNSYLKLEDERITRDFNNNLNRIGNIDVNNIKKTVKAYEEFKHIYDSVKADKKLKYFNEKEKKYFKLRIKHPDWPLLKLAQELTLQGIKTSKSLLNHWNRKLKAVYEN